MAYSLRNLFCAGAFSVIAAIGPASASEASERLTIHPSETDSTITAADEPHIVVYSKTGSPGPLFVWMAGTNGRPDNGTKPLFAAAVSLGYRVIGVSYIDQPGISQVCLGEALGRDSECSAKVRTKRLMGENVSDLIPDGPQDAVIHRLTALLKYLAKKDPSAGWEVYLDGDAPNWSVITVAGQSQGGGMAAFLAKKFAVDRVVDFSGGWDHSRPGEMAAWYSAASATQADRFYGTYNAQEPAAEQIAQSYAMLGIPSSHQFRLDKSSKLKPHVAGFADPVYRDVWIKMLSRPSP